MFQIHGYGIIPCITNQPMLMNIVQHTCSQNMENTIENDLKDVSC